MKPHISEQTKVVDAALADACRRQLGRNFVSLVAIGSRANGDELPDSDYDGFCYVRDAGRARLDLTPVERSSGIRIGIGIRPLRKFMDCVAFPEDVDRCPNRGTMAALKLGRGRTVGGRDLLRLLPPLRRLLPRDWRREAQLDYWLAVLDLPTNVLRREPRRHVGFIIAICDSLVRYRGIAVRKRDLPAALKRHHPGFRVIGLLRRALRRRERWPMIGRDRREILRAGQDVRRFLVALKRYVFRGDGTDLAPQDAREWRKKVKKTLRGPA